MEKTELTSENLVLSGRVCFFELNVKRSKK